MFAGLPELKNFLDGGFPPLNMNKYIWFEAEFKWGKVKVVKKGWGGQRNDPTSSTCIYWLFLPTLGSANTSPGVWEIKSYVIKGKEENVNHS